MIGIYGKQYETLLSHTNGRNLYDKDIIDFKLISISKPVDYPIVNPDMISISGILNYQIVREELVSISKADVKLRGTLFPKSNKLEQINYES